MMYAKLALKNAKKSIRDYLIYIITLTACVSMFYAFLSISSKYYRPDIGNEFDIQFLGDGIQVVILSITALLIFLIRYVNRFMIRKRLKEFAVQSIIGMEQSVIACIFFGETLIMGIISLSVGIVLGIVFSQLITAMLLQMFHKPFQLSFMLFPDTAFLTVSFFLICFFVVGLFQVQTIRKIKIIDMLYADRKNEDTHAPYTWIRKIVQIHFLLNLLMGIYGIRTLTYYFSDKFLSVIKLWCIFSIFVPFFMAIIILPMNRFIKKGKILGYLTALLLFGVFEIILIGFLPILKTHYMLPMDTGAFNLYLAFLIWCLVFIVSVFFILLSSGLLELKNRALKVTYRGENLFFFGQILSKLKTNTQSMTLICLTLIVSVSLFLLTPILVGWAQVFLEKRTPYDIQISSDYIEADSVQKLPATDYAFLSAYLEKQNVKVREECIFATRFLQASDFEKQQNDPSFSPVTAISLSDYNSLMKMLGYEQISLESSEYTTQWISITPKNEIQQYLQQHQSISTDAGTLKLSDTGYREEELGETLYSFQNVVCIVPDSVAEKLEPANFYRYVITQDPVPYAVAEEIQTFFTEHYTKSEQKVYSISTSTVEINDTSAAIFVMQTALTYSAIVLFVICFTILALQQLSDSDKLKYRLKILRHIGVEEEKIQKTIIKQLGIWFGVPVGIALIFSSVFFIFVLFSFSSQIIVYIGIQKLLQQIVIVLIILLTLLFCYFTGTWILFSKSTSD